MKLSRIAGPESTVKSSFSFKLSTADLLEKYRALYCKEMGVDVNLKDVVERMLLDFMASDAQFQRHLRDLRDRETMEASTTGNATTSPAGPGSEAA